MGLFGKQLQNVIEWENPKQGQLFWKWDNDEIKKDSVLIIRPGQDAIFMYNGVVEGVFEDEGRYEIQSDIIPFLTTLKSWKFGFNTPLRAEVLFINTKTIQSKWGSKAPINLRAEGLPGGMPIRCFGTFEFAIDDHDVLIEQLAGVKKSYGADEVRDFVVTRLNPLLMTWIGKEGRDMFNLQADALKIGEGIRTDLDMAMRKLGIAIRAFNVENFSYPEEVAKMQKKVAGQSMVGDVNKYSQVSMADSLGKGGTGGSMASDMAGMQMGMMMGQQMAQNMKQSMTSDAQQTNQGNTSKNTYNQQPNGGQGAGTTNGVIPNFCPNCGAKTNGANFCSNCGFKLI